MGFALLLERTYSHLATLRKFKCVVLPDALSILNQHRGGIPMLTMFLS